MKYILQILSFFGLILTIGPSIAYKTGWLVFFDVKIYMFIGTLVWFGTAVFWLGKKNHLV